MGKGLHFSIGVATSEFNFGVWFKVNSEQKLPISWYIQWFGRMRMLWHISLRFIRGWGRNFVIFKWSITIKRWQEKSSIPILLQCIDSYRPIDDGWRTLSSKWRLLIVEISLITNKRLGLLSARFIHDGGWRSADFVCCHSPVPHGRSCHSDWSTCGDLYRSFIKIKELIDWLTQRLGQPITDSTSRPAINQSKFFLSSCNNWLLL